MDIFKIDKPFVFTIFGASGDLAKLKIFPALFALAEQKRLPERYAIIGYARSEKSVEVFREEFSNSVKSSLKSDWDDYKQACLKDMLEHVFYHQGQYDSRDDFCALREYRRKVLTGKAMEVSYFSVPPSVYKSIIANLSWIREPADTDVRLIIEKPLGNDEESSRELASFIRQNFRDEEIYLLDHYLGKKAVRSLVPLRQMNRIFHFLMKGDQIENIQITAHETVGVGKRIGYFDKVGTIKDMIQSHLLQMLALLGMAIPVEKNAETIQNEKACLLSSLIFKNEPHSVALGQYEGYQKQDPKVMGSKTPTYAALKLYINREEWRDVPIFLRTGKHLKKHQLNMVVELKKFAHQSQEQEPNRVIIEFFPDEKVHIEILDEDGTCNMGQVSMSQSIACTGDYCLPNHGLLFLDVFKGDKTFFLSFDEIFWAWKIIDKVLKYIEEKEVKTEEYFMGTMGPDSRNKLMENQLFDWYEV
jgi:glucose-6-phosphate 1-dehydrogenase